jgi:hypothetical protein
MLRYSSHEHVVTYPKDVTRHVPNTSDELVVYPKQFVSNVKIHDGGRL